MPQRRPSPSQTREDGQSVIGLVYTDGCTEALVTSGYSGLHGERRVFVEVRKDDLDAAYVWDMSREQALALAALLSAGAAEC